MTCEEIRDLIPGYVLNALEPSEMDRVDEHLLTCREHDEELVDLRATGMSLALLDEAAQPSPHLRDRVRAAAGPTSVPLALRAALVRAQVWASGTTAGLAAGKLLIQRLFRRRQA